MSIKKNGLKQSALFPAKEVKPFAKSANYAGILGKRKDVYPTDHSDALGCHDPKNMGDNTPGSNS